MIFFDFTSIEEPGTPGLIFHVLKTYFKTYYFVFYRIAYIPLD